jgi:hypothetical protein
MLMAQIVFVGWDYLEKVRGAKGKPCSRAEAWLAGRPAARFCCLGIVKFNAKISMLLYLFPAK